MAWREDPPRSGRWRKQISIKGVRHMLTFHGSKADTLAYEAQRRVELGQAPAKQGTVYGFETYCADIYKPYAKSTLRASTWNNSRKYQVETLILFFGRMKLPDIHEPEIEAYRQKRLAAGISKGTINDEVIRLGTALKYAREQKLPCSDPKIPHYKITRSNKDKVQCWTRDEAAKLLSTAKEHASWFYPLFLFLFETGARKSEPIALTWKRVDFTQKTVRIWNDETTQYEVKSREREVPLSDHLLLVLKEQKLRWGKSEYVFPTVTNRFEGQAGEKMAEFPDASFTRILGLAGLKGSPHKTRHTFASLFLRAKPDLFMLGRILGHSHSRVTELYSHLLPEHLAEARGVVSFAPVVPPAPSPEMQNAISMQSQRRKTKNRKET
jgi:integrase